MNRTHVLAAAVIGLMLVYAACSTEPSPQTLDSVGGAQLPPATASPAPPTADPTARSTPEPAATTVPPTRTPDVRATVIAEMTATAIAQPTESVAPTSTLSPSPAPTATPAVTPAPALTATAVPVIPTPLPATPTPVQTPSPMSTLIPTATPPQTAVSAAMWYGLEIDDEDRCSPYDPDDYPYPQSVEARIVAEMGDIIYGPYTGRRFSSTRETDIEHMVARSEAHDSGLCAADSGMRRRFASDLLNLTLASPGVNRHQKSDKDAEEWLPDLNQCWFADRVTRVRQEYGLTIDQVEADALDAVLSGCSSFEMVVVSATEQASPTLTPTPTAGSTSGVDALAMWDDNGNGRISCAEARNHGIAPVRRGHPAYPYMNDRDGDGVVCE